MRICDTSIKNKNDKKNTLIEFCGWKNNMKID